MTEVELERLVIRLVGDATGYQKMINQSISGTHQMEKKIGMSLNSIGNSVGGLMFQMRAMAAIESPFGIMKEGIHLAAEAETNSAAFGVMLQDLKKGIQLEKDILKFGAETPLQASGIQQATKMLLQFNAVTEDTAIPTLRMLGDVVGGDQQRLMQMSLAFGQAQSTGRLMGQDLLQMINAGFNPLQEISRTTGKTVIELKEDMEKGRITVDVLKAAFKSATSEGGRFKDGMLIASKTFEGLASSMKDDVDAFKRSVGQLIIEEFHLKEAIMGVSTAAKASSKWLKEIHPIVKTTVILLAGLTVSLGVLVVSWKVATIAAGAFSGTLGNIVGAAKGAAAAIWAYTAAIIGTQKVQAGFIGPATFTQATQAQTRAGMAGAAATAGKAVGAAAAVYGMQALIDELPMHQRRLKSYKDSIDEITRAQNELTEALKLTLEASREQSKALGGSVTNAGRDQLEEELRQRTQLMGQESGTTRSQGDLESANAELARLKRSTMAFMSHLIFTETRTEAEIKKAEQAVHGATERYEMEAKRIQEIKEQLAKPPGSTNEQLKALREYTTELERQAQTIGMTAEQVKLHELKQLGLTSAQLANARGLQEVNKQLTYEKARMDEASEAVSDLIDRSDAFTKKLQDEADAIGMTSDEIEIRKFRMEGLDDAFIQHKLRLMEVKKTSEEHNRAVQDGKALMEQYATPVQKANTRLMELNKLLDSGLDKETYARALNDVAESLDASGAAALGARTEIERLDAVLTGSAEAKHRIASFTEKMGLQRSGMSQDPTRGGGGSKEANTLLKDIRDILKGQKKNQVVVKPANLGGG